MPWLSSMVYLWYGEPPSNFDSKNLINRMGMRPEPSSVESDPQVCRMNQMPGKCLVNACILKSAQSR